MKRPEDNGGQRNGQKGATVAHHPREATRQICLHNAPKEHFLAHTGHQPERYGNREREKGTKARPQKNKDRALRGPRNVFQDRNVEPFLNDVEYERQTKQWERGDRSLFQRLGTQIEVGTESVVGDVQKDRGHNAQTDEDGLTADHCRRHAGVEHGFTEIGFSPFVDNDNRWVVVVRS